jgi:hypothetical protein
MKTPKTKLVSTLVVWEQMHEALRAITRTEQYVREFNYEYGRVSSVTNVNYDVSVITDAWGTASKKYTYKGIVSTEVPVHVPLDSIRVEQYINAAYNFILECKELEKPKFTDFFDGLKELEKLPTEDDLKEYPKLVGHIELP